MSRPSLYAEAVAAGISVDHHESDLYLPWTAEVREMLKTHGKSGVSAVPFRSEIDGTMWVDVPFSYDPWWLARCGRI